MSPCGDFVVWQVRGFGFFCRDTYGLFGKASGIATKAETGSETARFAGQKEFRKFHKK
jgi:hypothetical protein